ncbi:MAG TPA: hypothetical protein VGM72_03160 [Micropepsaceae bacterium]|jgi:hypothetical protein
MRAWIFAIAISVAFTPAPAAFAAPTCQDQNGATIKCGIPGAMPVGWRLSVQERLDRQMPAPEYQSANELLKLICVIGIFFALMALMPEFDGRRAGDWDRQEDDGEDRR